MQYILGWPILHLNKLFIIPGDKNMSNKELFKKKDYLEPTCITLTRADKKKLKKNAEKYGVSFSEYARKILIAHG